MLSEYLRHDGRPAGRDRRSLTSRDLLTLAVSGLLEQRYPGPGREDGKSSAMPIFEPQDTRTLSDDSVASTETAAAAGPAPADSSHLAHSPSGGAEEEQIPAAAYGSRENRSGSGFVVGPPPGSSEYRHTDSGQVKWLKSQMLNLLKGRGKYYLNLAVARSPAQPPAEYGGFFFYNTRTHRVTMSPVYRGEECNKDGCIIRIRDVYDIATIKKRDEEEIIGSWHTHPLCGPGWVRHHSGSDMSSGRSTKSRNKAFLGTYVVNVKGEISFNDVSGFGKGSSGRRYFDRLPNWTKRDESILCEKVKNWR